MGPTRDIAVVGMACRFPGADDVEEFWANLVQGRDTISRSAAVEGSSPGFVRAVGKLTDVKGFDSDYFKITPSEALTMDPQQRLLLEVAASAMEDAGYAGYAHVDGRGPSIGVFVGGGEDEYLREFAAPSTGRDPYNDLRLRTGNGKDFLAARLAFKLNFTGPSLTVQAGCATGLVALGTACNALLMGDCDVALVGAVSLVMPDIDGYEYEPGGILSADGYCRPFDAQASGTVPSSGVGIVVLKRDEDAVRDRDSRRAIVTGWAVNNDGGSRAGFTVPNITGQSRVIRRALDRAGIEPADVGFLETHGTATAVGDAVEFEALKQVFGGLSDAEPCLLGATKANIGHTDAAAGMAAFIKSVLVVERGVVPEMIHFDELNPNVDLSDTPFVVPTTTLAWARPGSRIAAMSSFGLGGNNSHAVVRNASARDEDGPALTDRVLALSARSPEQLDELIASTGRWFRERVPMSPPAFADAAFTLATGRRRFDHRWAIAVGDAEQAASAMAKPRRLPKQISRHELFVNGSVGELRLLGQGQLASEPAYQAALSGLASELGQLSQKGSEVEPAVVTVLGVVRCLADLGLTFARIDGVPWIRPVLAWLATGGNRPGALAQAVGACAHILSDEEASRARNNDPAPEKSEESAGRIILDAGFSLPATVATAWASGALINLEGLYLEQKRRRISMPSAPFAKQQYWLPRSSKTATAASEQVEDSPSATQDVEAVVTRIWGAVLGLELVDADAHFIDDLGGDSMYAVEIGAQLNEELGLDLPIDLPIEAPTINQTVAAVRAALGAEE